MSRTKQRRHFTGQEKMAIRRRQLVERVAVSDLCEEYEIHPTLFYRRQKDWFDQGAGVFDSPQGEAGVHTVGLFFPLPLPQMPAAVDVEDDVSAFCPATVGFKRRLKGDSWHLYRCRYNARSSLSVAVSARASGLQNSERKHGRRTASQR